MRVDLVDIDFHKVDLAIKRVQLSEFVAKQEEGLNTQLEE